MLNYALICDMEHLKNTVKSRSFGMIKVLFVCHGSIRDASMKPVKSRGFGT